MERELQGQINTINQKIKELNAAYHMAGSKSGISDGEISIWSALLNSEKEYSQQDLCDLLFLPRQTVNSIISNFVKKGFVVLEHIPGTRNQKVIQLTEAGRAYGKDKVMWIFEAEHAAMDGTDPQEVRACVSMLEKYICKFKKKIEEK